MLTITPDAADAIRAVLGAKEGGARGGQDGHRQLPPVAHGLVPLRGAHLGEVVVVALGEGGDGRLERRLGEQVVRCGHVASMARRLRGHEPFERRAQAGRDLDRAALRAIDEHVDEPAGGRGVGRILAVQRDLVAHAGPAEVPDA